MELTSPHPAGVDVDAITAWFGEHVPGTVAPLAFELVPGGRSNLTFVVSDATGQRSILRRPPLGQVLATAHDVGREFRIISALEPTAVPVPPAYGVCIDPAVNGAPFYVMDFVDGLVVRDVDVGRAALDESHQALVARSLIDVLAALHAVDPDAVGLGDLGRKEGYIARQLKRWHRQWNDSRTRDLPAVDEVHDRLATHIPVQGAATIVHGDYRIDNCMVGADHRIAAVLDWELCTLGDPLADVGMLLICWTRPGDELMARIDSPTVLPGFPDRDHVLERYAEASGRDVSAIAYYQAFSFWKLACISEGVFARYAGGAMGAQPGIDLTVMADGVKRLSEAARLTLDRTGAA
jgi:aminoglycoside phosphotransferase (APT) family kinase protein